MTAIELLRQQNEMSYQELLTALEGVEEAKAWAVLPPAADDYLHTDGSIQGLVLHMATGRMMYASAAFRELEYRWQDLAGQLDEFEPSWEAAKAYLAQSQEYWLSSWANLTDGDLHRMVPHFSGKEWPVWKVLNMISQHDAYHTGQIVVVKYATLTSSEPPPSQADDIRQYCRELPSW